MTAEDLTPEERALVERHREVRRKRGAHWLTPEGRAELRETFPNPEDGNAVRPLLDALDTSEKWQENAISLLHETEDRLCAAVAERDALRAERDEARKLADEFDRIAEAQGENGMRLATALLAAESRLAEVERFVQAVAPVLSDVLAQANKTLDSSLALHSAVCSMSEHASRLAARAVAAPGETRGG